MESYVFESFFATTTITILDVENAPESSRIKKLGGRTSIASGFKMHEQIFYTSQGREAYDFFMRNLNKPCMLLLLQKEGFYED